VFCKEGLHKVKLLSMSHCVKNAYAYAAQINPGSARKKKLPHSVEHCEWWKRKKEGKAAETVKTTPRLNSGFESHFGTKQYIQALLSDFSDLWGCKGCKALRAWAAGALPKCCKPRISVCQGYNVTRAAK